MTFGCIFSSFLPRLLSTLVFCSIPSSSIPNLKYVFLMFIQYGIFFPIFRCFDPLFSSLIRSVNVRCCRRIISSHWTSENQSKPIYAFHCFIYMLINFLVLSSFQIFDVTGVAVMFPGALPERDAIYEWRMSRYVNPSAFIISEITQQ